MKYIKIIFTTLIIIFILRTSLAKQIIYKEVMVTRQIYDQIEKYKHITYTSLYNLRIDIIEKEKIIETELTNFENFPLIQRIIIDHNQKQYWIEELNIQQNDPFTDKIMKKLSIQEESFPYYINNKNIQAIKYNIFFKTEIQNIKILEVTLGKIQEIITNNEEIQIYNQISDKYNYLQTIDLLPIIQNKTKQGYTILQIKSEYLNIDIQTLTIKILDTDQPIFQIPQGYSKI